jgi:hypothetical protein
MTAQLFFVGRRPSNQLSYKPTNQTEKWYGRRERRDNKSNAEAASKILGAGPGQIIAMIGKMSMASITPMPCPASKTLETIVQARENNKTFGRDIATTESHIADRAEPKFGHRRQVKYKATNGQFITAKSNGRSRMNVEKLYPEGLG